MTVNFIHRLVAFVLLTFIQVLILNQVSLFGCITPLLYIWFAITFPRNSSRCGMLIWCFLLGLVNDIFNNTPGVATASMTVMGLIQPYVLMPFIPRESAEDLLPSVRTLGWGSYALYSLIMTAAFVLLYYLLESFSFFNFFVWFAGAVGSTIVTYIIIIVLENFRRSQVLNI